MMSHCEQRRQWAGGRALLERGRPARERVKKMMSHCEQRRRWAGGRALLERGRPARERVNNDESW
jgi:hypothetical protein